MRRVLRLLVLWLFALALPAQGALAAAGMATPGTAPAHAAMTMAGDTASHAAGMPCHGHAVDKAGGCGACCGPLLAEQVLLAVAPTALRWNAVPPATVDAAPAQFLTGGTDRPPRHLLA